MNLSWLEDFLALAASGNFSRAAELRHMTQPAFRRRIRSLEEWLGVVLFDRSSHPAALTETGQWLRTAAQEILARVARVPDEARAVVDAGSATLRFAATHALSLSFLPPWLRSLESRTPVGPIQLVSDVLQQCEALMMWRAVAAAEPDRRRNARRPPAGRGPAGVADSGRNPPLPQSAHRAAGGGDVLEGGGRRMTRGRVVGVDG